LPAWGPSDGGTGNAALHRPLSADDSDRARRFEIGTQDGTDLLIDVFARGEKGAI
jgi:hypothetical protein